MHVRYRCASEGSGTSETDDTPLRSPAQKRMVPLDARFPPMRSLTILGVLLGLVLSAAGAPAAAQQGAGPYEHSALNVVPRWNGLAVVRGENEAHVATLGFFWAGSLNGAFDADPRAAEFGRQARRTRRIAATLTDLGAVAIAVGVIRATGPRGVDPTARLVALSGIAALGVSVPLQFKADGELSRAVWHFNARFAQPSP